MSLTPKTLTFFFPLFLHSVCFRACPFVCLFRLSLCTWPLWEAVESPAQERTRRVGICASPASCLTFLNLGFFFFFGHRMRSCLRPEEAGWCDKKLAFLGSYGGPVIYQLSGPEQVLNSPPLSTRYHPLHIKFLTWQSKDHMRLWGEKEEAMI